MKTVEIYSKNADYQKFEVLKTNRNKRYKYGEFIIEGVRNINEAIRNKWKIVSLIYPGGRSLSRWASDLIENIDTTVNFKLAGTLMEDISDKAETSELMAIVQMRGKSNTLIPDSENPVVVLFDTPSNKGNLGTMFRSCDAFGIDLLIITGHAVDIYDPEVIRSSMGSFFSVPFIRMSENSEIDAYAGRLKRRFKDMKVIGTTAHKQVQIKDVDMTVPVLILIGNETNGLNRHLCDICDVMVTIPMSGNSSASSLNVACAASVIFYEANRQRGC